MVGRIPALAAETYRRGLSVLVDALELIEAMREPRRGRLQAETAELERETATSRADRPALETVEIRKATLVSHRERIALLDRQQLHVDQLLYQGGRCEASLHRTRIELAANPSRRLGDKRGQRRGGAAGDYPAGEGGAERAQETGVLNSGTWPGRARPM